MKFTRFRLLVASMVAFLMGMPFAAQAKAGDDTEIVGSALDLAMSIIDAAGNS